MKNLYPVNFVALGDAYAVLGDKDKSKSYYQKAVETWRNLQTEERLYMCELRDLAETEGKITNN